MAEETIIREEEERGKMRLYWQKSLKKETGIKVNGQTKVAFLNIVLPRGVWTPSPSFSSPLFPILVFCKNSARTRGMNETI